MLCIGYQKRRLKSGELYYVCRFCNYEPRHTTFGWREHFFSTHEDVWALVRLTNPRLYFEGLNGETSNTANPNMFRMSHEKLVDW